MNTIDEIYPIFIDNPRIVTDSRSSVSNAIFIALKGEKFDGNHFAREAIRKGASLAIIDNPDYLLPGQCILVEDTLQTLQDLARMHRRNNTAKIIGITGSNGKTTTKELIGAVLSSAFKTIITQGNLNNHIGVPLTLLSLKNDTEFAVVEMGANHPGEIDFLCEIAHPDYGIVTNIGKAHLEGFGSLEGVAGAKTELYRFIRKNNGLLFVNKDNELLMNRAGDTPMITYGTSPGAGCSGRIVNRHPAISLGWTWQNLHGFANTNLYGDYNFENILAAICIGMYLGVSPADVSRALQAYLPENNRSQWLHTPYNKIFLDAYNANPSSMKAALLNFSRLPAPDKTVILGDMMELGDTSHQEHADIITLLRKLQFTRCILIGRYFKSAAANGSEICFDDPRQAEIHLEHHPLRHSTILLKGSRANQLEKLIPLL